MRNGGPNAGDATHAQAGTRYLPLLIIRAIRRKVVQELPLSRPLAGSCMYGYAVLFAFPTMKRGQLWSRAAADVDEAVAAATTLQINTAANRLITFDLLGFRAHPQASFAEKPRWWVRQSMKATTELKPGTFTRCVAGVALLQCCCEPAAAASSVVVSSAARGSCSDHDYSPRRRYRNHTSIRQRSTTGGRLAHLEARASCPSRAKSH
jgi:hypothetical protein